MAFTSVPNFDDPNAKINERIHSKSGAKIIEVLYGARDEHGNPCSPEKNNNDGHGHWVALEIDGLYQIIMWRHPKSEGGEQEYGTSRSDHPLKDLEDDIEKKKALLKEARALMKDRDYDPEKVDSILDSYTLVYSMGTPKELELDEQHRRLKEKNGNNRNRFNENRYRKQNLIAEALTLQKSTEWKATSQRMKVMMDEWKTIGSAGKENNRLWEQFTSARQVFYDNRERYFQKVSQEREQHRQQKESMIQEAKRVAYSTDWRATNDIMDELLKRWKRVGSAGKDYDDRLWNAFQEARNIYYDRRKADKAEKDRVYATRRQQKNSLISEARGHIGDYSPSTATRMKQLSNEWKAIGSCGRESDEILWQQFRAAQDSYWSSKKENSRAKTEAAIKRRRERISRLYEQNRNLHERINTTRNSMKQDQLYGYISENESRIRELEMEIGRMEQDLWR